MKILLATHNPSKFERYNNLLREVANLELVSLQGVSISEKVDEPFATAKENAIHKAVKYARISQLPTLAVDEAVTTNFLLRSLVH
ncbi:non-canonical purine NTP pyrophosphatase [Dictyobacter halimunensis]